MKTIFKKAFSLCLSVFMLMALLCPTAFAAESRLYDSGLDSGIEISTEGGKEIELYGHVEPTIISVTMPSYIPFDISKSILTDNKVVSPKIDIVNNSKVPLNVVVDRARVDLSRLPGVTWSDTGSVSSTQIAVGLTEAQTAPTYLYNAHWLKNDKQNTQLIRLGAQGTGRLFIVGNIGMSVPENQTFSVIPTLVVRTASY